MIRHSDSKRFVALKITGAIKNLWSGPLTALRKLGEIERLGSLWPTPFYAGWFYVRSMCDVVDAAYSCDQLLLDSTAFLLVAFGRMVLH